MLALQAVGAAAGNMIAIHNVVAASATVGLLGREGATLVQRRRCRPSTTCWPPALSAGAHVQLPRLGRTAAVEVKESK